MTDSKEFRKPKATTSTRTGKELPSFSQGSLFNKERYGYMGCPSRLLSGDRKLDQDIICPCVYRVSDVEECGSCYCNLYVSREWNEEKIPHAYVPERRPEEKYPR